MTKIKTTYFIREYYDRPASKKEFLEHKKKEISKAYFRQSQLLDKKLLTSWKIKAYEKSGLLKPIIYRGGKYFKQEDVLALLKRQFGS